MQGSFLTRSTGRSLPYRNLFAADFIEKNADPFPVMVIAKAVLWISTSQSMMDLGYQCPESCTDQGSAPSSLWKHSTEHYSSVGGRLIWLTSCSSKFSGIWDLQSTHLKGQMDKAVSLLCLLLVICSVSSKVTFKTIQVLIFLMAEH